MIKLLLFVEGRNDNHDGFGKRSWFRLVRVSNVVSCRCSDDDNDDDVVVDDDNVVDRRRPDTNNDSSLYWSTTMTIPIERRNETLVILGGRARKGAQGRFILPVSIESCRGSKIPRMPTGSQSTGVARSKRPVMDGWIFHSTPGQCSASLSVNLSPFSF